MKNRSLSTVLMDGILYKNPLLVKMLSLSVAVLACGTCKDALALGICTFLTLLLSSLTLSAVRKILTEGTKTLACLFISCGYVSVIAVAVKACFPTLHEEIGTLLPFIAASGLCLSFGAGFASKNGISSTLVGAVASGLGYMAALLVTAAVRELFGRGTLFGITAFGGGIPFLTTPAGGFICLAFIAALVSFINSKRRDENDGK